MKEPSVFFGNRRQRLPVKRGRRKQSLAMCRGKEAGGKGGGEGKGEDVHARFQLTRGNTRGKKRGEDERVEKIAEEREREGDEVQA